jgi:hypothetical protein
MRERFIPTEEFDHLKSASLVGINHFNRCEKLVHGKMDMDHVHFRSRTGAPAQLVRGFRACDEQVSTPHAAS